MAFCGKCGNPLQESDAFCTKCGAPVQAQKDESAAQAVAQTSEAQKAETAANDSATTSGPAQQATGSEQKAPNAPPYYDPYGGDPERRDAAQNKAMGILSYIGILALVPLFAAKESPFAQYHAKQGLTLCIIEIAYAVLTTILRWVFSLIFRLVRVYWIYNIFFTVLNFVFFIGGALLLVLAVIGIVNAVNGKKEPLPVLGKLKLFK